MSEPQPPTGQAVPPPVEKTTAGQLLRQARLARGLHIAALAASIKVLPRKLEALEADRYEELPDATFTRALAQTICRSLKIEPAPVLALLPKASGMQLDSLGLNAPFRERQGHVGPKKDPKKGQDGHRAFLPPRVWLPLLLVFAAVLLYFAPQDFHPLRSFKSLMGRDGAAVQPGTGTQPQDPALSPSAAVMAESAVLAQLPASVAVDVGSVGQAVSSAAPALLELSVSQASWIEVQDGAAKPLLARIVQPQEAVALNASLPLRLKVGNASKTTVRFRGEPVDLAPMTRDNVARLELK